jgi:hypothetical protein
MSFQTEELGSNGEPGSYPTSKESKDEGERRKDESEYISDY